ncbi:MAG: ABC transporter ATP-binding protein [Limnochordales bacterium]|nr:ABC transporter ATP-binding protein [Limnochordales bacterium]
MRYAKPYWHRFVLAIIMALAVAAAGLVQPLLMQRAIDDHIIGPTKPMVAFTPGTEPVPGVLWQGKVYVRESALKDKSPAEGAITAGRYQLVLVDGQAYLVTLPAGVVEITPPYKVEDGQVIVAGGLRLPAQALDESEADLFRARDIARVRWLALLLLALLTFSFLTNYGQTYLLHRTGQQIMYDLRQELYRHLQSLSLSFFDRNPTGRLVTRVTNDVEALNEMYTGLFVNLFRDLFLLIGIVVAMFGLSPRLATLALLTLPVLTAVTYAFRMRVREAYRQVRTRLARINAAMAENISGMRVIQIFHREQAKLAEFARINKDYYDASMVQLLIFAIFRPAIDLISTLAVAMLLWFGGVRVIEGTVSFGVLFAFISYIQQFFRPISDLTEQYNVLQTAMASAERIFQLLDTQERIPVPANPRPLGRIRGEVEFDHVWFAYKGEEWVLRDVSFRVEPGQTVALVGATGAGKSSIISLLSRLYDIQKGSIRVDGIDIREVDPAELRRQIAVVLQDVFLFTGDIASNIRLNNTEIDDERVRWAAEVVGAMEFIEKLPGGLAARVTERGSTLSAGQRQLIAFARALAFDPRILVLDEATANIDTETEQLIQAALARLIKGRTTIVIAHRLSTIQNADKIIVLHKGRIREMGRHEELLALGGLYYDLYRLQYKLDVDGNTRVADPTGSGSTVTRPA